jgi:hypothetical protein
MSKAVPIPSTTLHPPSMPTALPSRRFYSAFFNEHRNRALLREEYKLFRELKEKESVLFVRLYGTVEHATSLFSL